MNKPKDLVALEYQIDILNKKYKNTPWRVLAIDLIDYDKVKTAHPLTTGDHPVELPAYNFQGPTLM